MGITILRNLLREVTSYQELKGSLSQTTAKAQSQMLDDAAPFALSTLWNDLNAPILVITPKAEDSRRMYQQLVLWSDHEDQVLHFPETETLPFERQVADQQITHSRLHVLSKLISLSSSPLVVVASIAAISQKTIARSTFTSCTHHLSVGQQLDLNNILDRWKQMGYRFETLSDMPGIVSRRGGIIDIFPIGTDTPKRIELWGDEIETIRSFDPKSQRSFGLVESVTVIPANETLAGTANREKLAHRIAAIDTSSCTTATRQRILLELDNVLNGQCLEETDFYSGFLNHGSLLDYFPENSVLVLQRPIEISETSEANEKRCNQLRTVKEQRGDLPLNFPSSQLLWCKIRETITGFNRILEVHPWVSKNTPGNRKIPLPFLPVNEYHGNFKEFARRVNSILSEGGRVVAITAIPKRLSEILAEEGIDTNNKNLNDSLPLPGSIALLQTVGEGLSDGFTLDLDDSQLAVFGDKEIFGIEKQNRSHKRQTTAQKSLINELSPGDYVVHLNHGIGQFMGTGKNPRDNEDTEYLILKYAHGDELHVPVDHLDHVTPYIALTGSPLALTRLGTQEWNRTKDKVEQGTRELASELLSLYAARKLAKGQAALPDTPWQINLEDSFPYEETLDQSNTISQVKQDMESVIPMDRLVCGDVGYGKTEIALRAAFKTVMSGKQVAFLVPTTILAQQHYVNFSQRLSAYPIKVEVLSRFRTEIEQKGIVSGLTNGMIDICIGTHRLVQKDVNFKNLGLVIVDEEQRFGVLHKERFKHMHHEVDILTLTATPIPRTLHLSLAGIRDMSTIQTPPGDRLPIKTYVSEFSDESIREAILRELDRQGQVYFIHNRVYNIEYLTNYIRKLVPEAKVAPAHGQMAETELAKTMLEFADRQIDVLICTTIIESGLDIPNVNTIIINRADTFGLAQLYQLRGRVGRGARRAYSYLLIPTNKSITESAEKRLKTMLLATELGAGYEIAMKDLEIRGAGNILGAKQSGHIFAVGFDLYTSLLNNAIEELHVEKSKDESGDTSTFPKSEKQVDASIVLGVPSNIPIQYVGDLSIRLGLYRRIATLRNLKDIESMEEELVDRFGPLPWQTQNLLYITQLKLESQKTGIESITKKGNSVILRLIKDVGGASIPIEKKLGDGVNVGNRHIRIDLTKHHENWMDGLIEKIRKLTLFMEYLSEITSQEYAK